MTDTQKLQGEPYEPGPRFRPREGRPSLPLQRASNGGDLSLEFLVAGNNENPKHIHFIVHGGGVCADHCIPTAARMLALMPDDLIIMPNAPHVSHRQKDKTPGAFATFLKNNIPTASRFLQGLGIARDPEEPDPQKRLTWVEENGTDWQNLTNPAERMINLVDTLSQRFNVPLEKMSMTGFSQGTGLSHYTCSQRKLGAFVAQSGPFPPRVEYSAENQLPMLVITGGKDTTDRRNINWAKITAPWERRNEPWVFENIMEFEKSNEKLVAQYKDAAEGMITLQHYPDMPHVTTSESRAMAAEWVHDTLYID